jgi:NAD(P)-dependent dehydrogenase (short-subunit alcohol dehydrogenase family)
MPHAYSVFMDRQLSNIRDNALGAKVVLVTGAGRGIGAAVAQDAARHGATVVVCDVDAAAAAETTAAISGDGGAAVAATADVSDWASVGDLIDATVRDLGSLDGLVNNAGRFAMAPMQESTPQMWSDMIATNILGVAICGQLAARQMLAQGSGSIVNVTSGAHAGMHGMSVYAATKGAVASLTYTWALELAEAGIRVNAVSPMAETRMMSVNREFTRHRDSTAPELPTAPPASANAPVISYLLSALSAGISGQVVRVSGGDIALCAHPAVIVPVLHREEWTLQQVRAAFDSYLGGRQFPAGLAGIQAPRLVTVEDPGWRASAGTLTGPGGSPGTGPSGLAATTAPGGEGGPR